MTHPTDPSQNVIGRRVNPLDAIFLPQSIAVIGAKDTPDSVGRTIFQNLIEGSYKGKVYPVNPKRKEVLGLPCYASLSEIPDSVDLAVIVTPAATVLQIVQDCIDKDVKGAIIISAGFKELGEEGLKRENEILALAKGKIRIIGPNCLGVMNPFTGMNATFAKGTAKPGPIAFLSQSGAMCTSVLDWSFQEDIGFSSFVSVGSMADVGWGDLIDYLGSDPNTESLLIYMETIGDPRAFLSAAREIALEKPIIVIKPGRTQAAARAAASHTGALAGSDEVFDAALERVGVMRVDTIGELFSMTSVLSRQPRPKGPRLAIVTNAGGPSVLATDSAAIHGVEISKLSEETITSLNKVLPAAWSHNNPVDILGDASAETYQKTVEIVSKDPLIDGLLVILSPQDVTDPTGVAKKLSQYSKLPEKPILASWMGGKTVAEGIDILNQAHIPTFEYPDEAAATYARMWNYSKNLKTLYEMPVSREERYDSPEKRQQSLLAKELIQKVRDEGRTLLDEEESKKLISLYDIPTVPTEVAKDVDSAVKWAEKMGFPVVLKLYSKTITHKTDVGGVKLNISSEEAVRGAWKEIEESVNRIAGPGSFTGVTVQKMIKLTGYEVILGSSIDHQFGPVLLFGTGGQLVEIYKDRSLALPPLNANLALMMMEKTKIFEAFKGVRGRKPVDINQLEDILVRFSEMIVENRWIKECDINPLLVSDEGIIALDARVVLEENEKDIVPLSIRPYPLQYREEIELSNGQPVTLRLIQPEDESLIIEFHKDLSANSVRQRFFEFVSFDDRIAHERLIRICFNDYDRELPLVAEITTDHSREIIGFARLSKRPASDESDLTMLIKDKFHHKGLGTQMIEQLISIAKREKIKGIEAKILSENHGMITICKRLGFEVKEQNEFTIAHLAL